VAALVAFISWIPIACSSTPFAGHQSGRSPNDGNKTTREVPVVDAVVADDAEVWPLLVQLDAR
jgi:hypothetical protein